MDSAKLREQYAAQLAEAKRLGEAFKGNEHEMPQATMDAIAGHLGTADEIKARLDLAGRMNAADTFLNEPATAPVIHGGWREAAPGEGNAPVDVKSWRSFTQKTILGEREMRFHVPLAVQHKDYPAAFESYLRKGYSEVGPNDRKTLMQGNDTAGGFLVPEDFQTDLIKKTAMMTQIRALARVVQTSRELVSWPRVNYASGTNDASGKIFTSGARLSWTGESPASSTSSRVTDPVFGKIDIPVHTAMASMPITNDLLEDAVFDVAGYGSDLLAEAFALGEDFVFLLGTGSNQPTGVLHDVDGNGPVSQKSGTNASLTTSADAHSGKRLNDLYYNTPAQYRMNGVFTQSSLTLQAMEDLVDGQKRPILRALSTGSMADGEPMTLKGKRLIVDEFMPELANSSNSVLFGDWSGYTIIDRVSIAITRLTELYAETNITVLLARKRVGGYCTEPYKFRVLQAGA